MTDIAGIAADRLRQFIERIERLHENRQAIADDIKDVFAEAKATGFDVPTMKEVIKLRRKDKDDRQEAEHLLDLYKAALDMD